MEIPSCTLSQPKVPKPPLTQGEIPEPVQNFYSIYPTETQSNQPISPRKSKLNVNIDLDFFHSFKPIIESLIQKKTQNMVWQSRYFVLTPTRLLYYSSSYKNQLKGCFNFVSLSKYQPQLKEQDGVLTLFVTLPASHCDQNKQETKQLLKLNFEENHGVLVEWKNHLMTVIAQSSTHEAVLYPRITPSQLATNKTNYSSGNYYWNKLFISQKEFTSYANHMDIVFFRSRRSSATFHRLMMRSHFDHVGLLFKDQLDRVFILEAIQSRGVWVTEWSSQLGHLCEQYEQIALKKLILAEGVQLDYQKLEEYLNQVIGKKYQLSFQKLLNSNQEETQNNKTIFRSQLKAIQEQQNENDQQKMARYPDYQVKAMEKVHTNKKLTNSKEDINNMLRYQNGLQESQENNKNISNNQVKSMNLISQKKIMNMLEEQKIPPLTQRNQTNNKEITFFCSQLIADIYIKFGLIKGRKKHQFWPMDFQGHLKLEGGAVLTPLMEIQF